ncbi:MAG: hypothetical protein ACRDJH_23575 [Thermomicrobiales bacterium]
MESRAIVMGGLFVLAGLFMIVAAILRVADTRPWQAIIGLLIVAFGVSLIRRPPRRRR